MQKQFCFGIFTQQFSILYNSFWLIVGLVTWINYEKEKVQAF